jgi:hypothetical protein
MEKLSLLRLHGVYISDDQIRETLQYPDKVLIAWEGRSIAQRILDEKHVLRVVYSKGNEDAILVITVYPARRGRY